MTRFAFAAIVTTCVGGTILFSACGDSTFTSTASDAQADVQPEDGSSASDGALVVGDAGRITPIVCTDGGHSLCDTFDEASRSPMWIVNGVCANAFLDTSKSVSPPSSLATNDLDSEAGCASAYANVESAGSTHFSSSFDVFLDAPSSDAYAPFFSIWATTSDYPFYEIALNAEAPGALKLLENLTLADGGPAYEVTPINAASLTPNAWNHVTIDVNFSGPNVVTLTLGESNPVTLTLKYRPSVGSISAYRVYLGIPNGGVGFKVAAHFDDFTCDVTP
jgi:hypothetical protein